MKENNTYFLLVLLLSGFFTFAQTSSSKISQNNPVTGHWFEAPESSNGDTIVFKNTKHVFSANEDPAYAWSDFTIKPNNSFDIAYWRWCPSGNYAYSGMWLSLPSGNIRFDFGNGKCKCEMQIISVNQTELKAIIKETSN